MLRPSPRRHRASSGLFLARKISAARSAYPRARGRSAGFNLCPLRDRRRRRRGPCASGRRGMGRSERQRRVCTASPSNRASSASPPCRASILSQIEAINTIFSPTAAEIDYCQKVLQAFEEANARGDGSIAFGGQLIDRPIVERARRTIDMAKSLGHDPIIDRPTSKDMSR